MNIYCVIFSILICVLIFSCEDEKEADVMYDCLVETTDVFSLKKKARTLEVYFIEKGILSDSTEIAYRSLFFKLRNDLSFRDSFTFFSKNYNNEPFSLSELYSIFTCCYSKNPVSDRYENLCRVVLNFETIEDGDFLKMDVFFDDLGRGIFESNVIYRGIFLDYLIHPVLAVSKQDESWKY